MTSTIRANEITTGVVGLGLMGCSITACLLMAGHSVIAVAPLEADLEFAEKRVHEHLLMSQQEGMVNESPEHYFKISCHHRRLFAS